MCADLCSSACTDSPNQSDAGKCLMRWVLCLAAARSDNQVIADPSERNDLYGDSKYSSVVAELNRMYEAERAVAVYPCLRGPSGKANAQGVLQPWLGPNDNCEQH